MNNGEFHPITDYPYVAQLMRIRKGSSEDSSEDSEGYYYEPENCGGAILSADWVISAAHCVRFVEDFSDLLIIAGSSLKLVGRNVIRVEEIYFSSYWVNEVEGSTDICLIKLESPIAFCRCQQPIQITRQFPKVGDKVTVAGYGVHHHGVSGEVLRSSQAPIIETKLCNDILEEKESISDKEFCTNATEVELGYGDSGSPAVFNNKLVGIMSSGTDHGKVNILVKISSYYDWILQTTGINYDD